MRVFLSAASGQFRDCREAVASDLRAVGATVVVQEDFRQHGHSLLEKLQEEIDGCDRVIAIVGDAYGAEPEAVARPAGSPRRSYTQWEYFLARGERLDGRRAPAKPVHVYLAGEGLLAGRPVAQEVELAELQRTFVEELRASGKDRQTFRSVEELRALVLRDGVSLAGGAGRQPNNLPYRTLGSLFKGREEFLVRLRAHLTGGNGRAVGVVAPQALYGLGGVGKTRLAVEYGWRYAGDYTALLFVGADTPEGLRRNLTGLVGPLVLDLKEAQQATEEEARVGAALAWLESHPGWFLILDNVDTRAAARAAEALLVRLRPGHVVITSRLSKWGVGVEELDLDVLDLEPSTQFLLERTARLRRPTPEDDRDARALAGVLDGLALALEQAGAFIGEVRCSLREYLGRWQRHDQQVLEWFDEQVMKYPRSVAVTWETTRRQLSEPAGVLLEALSWLAADPLPEGVVRGEAAGLVLGEAGGEMAVAELERYSLLRREAGEGGWLLSVHRLVQEVTRRRLGEKAGRERLVQALAVVDRVAVGDPMDVRNWGVWQPLAAHVRAVVDHAETAAKGDPTARLMSDLATFYYARALHAEAEPLMRRALDIDERGFGQDHPKVAIRLNNLAQLLQATNRLTEAEPLMRRALDIDERSFGQDHPNVATDLNNLAGLLYATNRLTEAEPLMRRVVTIFEKAHGVEHANVASALNNLASLLQATNRLTEAEPLMRRVVTIFEKAHGAAHPNVGAALNNLARLLYATNRLTEAEPLMRRALDIDESSLGHDHPNVAMRLNNLAILLQATNRLTEAEPLVRRALAIDENSFGHDHPNVARNLNTLAQLLQDANRLTEAEPLSRRHLQILLNFTRSTGHEHSLLQAALRNYSGILRAQGLTQDQLEARLRQLQNSAP